MTVKRFDFASIDPTALERTPSGGLVIPASLTRTGVFTYKTPDGKEIRELRTPKEVFAPASLSSLQGATVTDGHPQEMVSTENWKAYARGSVVPGSVKPEGKFVIAKLAVEDASCIAKIDAGNLREISCGYGCDIDETPGVTDTGERYDRAQTNIVYNHVALGPKGWGRAGSSVGLRLDSTGNMVHNGGSKLAVPWRKPVMKHSISRVGTKLRIDGVGFTLANRDGRKQAREALSALVQSVKNESAGIRTDAATPAAMEDLAKLLQSALEMCASMAEATVPDDAAMDAEEKPAEDMPPASAKDADSEAKPEETQAKMDARVDARVAILDKARLFVPSLVAAGKSDAAIMREALAARKFRHDGLSDAEVRGAFAVLEPVVVRTDALMNLGAATGALPSVRTDSAEPVDGSAAYSERLRNGWKRK
jgi:hypothetical protein